MRARHIWLFAAASAREVITGLFGVVARECGICVCAPLSGGHGVLMREALGVDMRGWPRRSATAGAFAPGGPMGARIGVRGRDSAGGQRARKRAGVPIAGR